MVINNINNKIDKISLSFILILGIFSSYVELNFIWNSLLVLDFLLLIALSKDFKKSLLKNNRVFFLTIVFCIFIIFNILSTNIYTYLTNNITNLIKVIMVSVIISGIASEDNDVFEKFLEKKISLINIVWIFNLFALTLQTAGTGFLIKPKWLAINSFYKDHCSGIFGNSGTHILSAFSMFILILNFYYADRKKLIGLKIFTIVTTIISLLLSTLNDNNSIFILYVLFGMYYMFKKVFYNNSKFSSIVTKMVLSIISIVVVATIIMHIPSINNYIKNDLLSRIDSVMNASSSDALGGNERLAIVEYSFNKGFGWKYGLGIGAWPFTKPDFLGFPHFGLSSIGSFIALGGLPFYIITILLYTFILLPKKGSQQTNKIDMLIIMMLMVILSIYTAIFTGSIIMLWIALSLELLNIQSTQKENSK